MAIYETGGQRFEYSVTGQGIRIDGCGGTGRICLPEEIEGEKVTCLGDYALSPMRQQGLMDVEEVRLPGNLRSIGRYAFYNCSTLHELHFYGGLSEIGAGAFTGCHQVKKLTAVEEQGKCPCLKEILSELTEEIEVRYCGDGEALLYFPEYFEEGVENTPARILENHVHGSGLFFRNCFRNREFQFREYDSRFDMAAAQESRGFLTYMCLGRLMYPYLLEEEARLKYEGFLKGHLAEAAAHLLKKRDMKRFIWLMENCGLPGERGWQDNMDQIFERAEKYRNAQAMSFLMDFRHRFERQREVEYEL